MNYFILTHEGVIRFILFFSILVLIYHGGTASLGPIVINQRQVMKE